MLSFTSPDLEVEDNKFKLSRASSIRSTSNASSCSSSSRPNIPFKPGHLRSTSAQVRVQNRIIRTVEIQQDCPASPRFDFSRGTGAYHGDQSTIKASQHRRPRETASSMRDLMVDYGSTMGASLHPQNGKVDDPLLKQPKAPRGCEQRRGHYNSSEENHLDINFENNNQFCLPLLARGKASKTPQQMYTFTPLITPQRAVALHCFDPEVSDTRDSVSEGRNYEKSTPEVRFQSQDVLEIWVPDIGGGWSLGKNLSRPNSYPRPELNQTKSDNFSDLGLIPIGWYQTEKNVQSLDTSYDLYKPTASASNLTTPKNRTHGHPLTQIEQSSLFYQREDRINAAVMNIKSFPSPSRAQESACGLIDLPSTEDIKTNRSSLEDSEAKTKPKRCSNSFGLNPSSRDSGCAPFSSILNPSVAVSKEFGTNAVFLDRDAKEIACSVTASDAMLAARLAHDRLQAGKTDLQGNSTSKQRNSNWNLLFPIGVGSRCSAAYSYITAPANCEKDPKIETDCTERYEIEEGPVWKDTVPFFTIAVHHPKLQVHRSKSKAHMIYTITSTFLVDNEAQDGSLTRVTVHRRYSHFERLSIGLESIYGEVFDLPPLPEKGYTTNYDVHSLCNRRRGLERYLVRLIRHPVLRYCPMLTTFLGCEEVEDFEREARVWGRLPAAPSPKMTSPDAASSTSESFFSKVFHPDYNVDEVEVHDSIESYNKYAKSMESGRATIELEKNLAELRNSIQNVSQDFEKISSSIQRFCAGLTSPHKPPKFSRKQRRSFIEDTGSDDLAYSSHYDDQKSSRTTKKQDGVTLNEGDLLTDLRREARDAGLQNSDGALCWKEGCNECLTMTKNFQLLGQSFGDVADTYSACAIETLAPVQDLLKELSFPHKSRKVLSNLYDSTKITFSNLNQDCSFDGFESRKETVMNVVMSEIERHHKEKHQDYRDLTKRLFDSQIKLHQTVLDRLKEASGALEQPQLTTNGSSEPRAINSEEVKAMSRQELNPSSSDITFSKKNEPISSSKYKFHLSLDQPIISSSSVLEWINRSAEYSKKKIRNDFDQPSHLNHRRRSSVLSNSSTIASSTLSSLFVKPLSAAFNSMAEFSDYLS